MSRLLVAIAVLCLSAFLASQVGQTARLGPDVAFEASVSILMQDEGIAGLAVGFVEGGRLVYSRGFGVENADGAPRPVTADTIFHMASITKTFVATAIMQLVERDRIRLDVPATAYLPYFRLRDPRYAKITVRQLLNHTSGMPDVADYGWDRPEFDERALERYVRSLTDQTLKFDPGAQFAYSNMA